MSLFICPHCNNGGFMSTCKECQTVICTHCKKTLQGVKYSTPDNQCPTCKQWAVMVRNES